MRVKSYLVFIFLLILFNGCATYKAQFLEENTTVSYPTEKTVEKRFFLIGDAGNAPYGETTLGLKAMKSVLDTISNQDYVLFLGDNLYPKGMPKKDSPNRELAEYRLDAQVNALEGFPGEIIFIPGNHEYYSEGVKGLEREEKYLNKKLKDKQKQTFFPKDGCGLTQIAISNDIQLVIMDSQWFLEDWDKNPGINDKCDIKTRQKLFLEVEDALKDNQEKTIIFAIHHPLYTNGPHGGQFAAEKHLFPFQTKVPMPVVASLITLVRKSGGISIQDRINGRYKQMADRLITLARNSDRIIFVSGHEHSLQYSRDEDIPQIVSGAGSKTSATKISNFAHFTYGKQGFAILDVFDDGSSWVRYYGAKGDGAELLFQSEIHKPERIFKMDSLPKVFPETISASVYKTDDTDKTELYEDLLGKHYRDVYGTKVKAKTVDLDTLLGGLTPVRMGGGHQSKTLRLVDKQGREYNMRALEKSATQFLQAVAFKDTYMEDDLENTLPERILKDFYTAAHPYASFVVGTLSDAVDVYHTNPKLYYIPKQKALGKYNEEYGGELYMIEERPMDEFKDLYSFGRPDDIDSTDKLFENLRKDEKYSLDEESYIRARLFDMLLGDWDRHEDQWRWAQFDKEDGGVVYKPIPRDRDQVFSNYDGKLLGSARTMITAAKMLQMYGDNLYDLEWFNKEPIAMDKILLQNYTRSGFKKEAEYIQKHLTDDVIDKAFKEFPVEVQTKQLEGVKETLKKRRGNLTDIANRYYEVLSKLVILKGTDKDDIFEINRSGDGETTIKIYRNIDGKKKKKMVDKKFYASETKEIWIYGLDEDDVFEIKGEGKHPIKIRIVGGQNNDIYKIENGKDIIVYDHKSKKNTIKEKGGANFELTDDYEINLFNYKKDKYTSGTFLPAVGFNPDDGVSLGIKATITNFGFERNPFTYKHTITAGYYFATDGFQLIYDGEVAKIFDKTNLQFGGRMTSDNFAQNFFGYGSDTPNYDDESGMDYNRIKMRFLTAYAGLVRRSNYGSDFALKVMFNGAEVHKSEGRFIDTFDASNRFFDWEYFSTLEGSYNFESYDDKLTPGRGMAFNLTTGFTGNLEDFDRNFGYLKSSVSFYNPISRSKRLVLKSSAGTHVNFGDGFEFYQAANLGGNTGLRGYRNQRFTGRNSLVFNEDVRYSLKDIKTSFLPLRVGVFAGIDYGRVWIKNDTANKWQHSYGGGMWINILDSVNTDVMLFTSDDGPRFSFAFGFKF
ncbi:hypothetical protein NBRC110019_04820 [Neptunitalea chrysea]|uniref:Calcineurin-like phosphoesterase domain-containing protein n=1 Tax=Neptunitalea chrysea TaxID=1647581 RepID=A0A9W6EVE6_9FLAO|nr:metallophosphoesterase [Neptunitalea chrysea]GLB51443.1 hypothetical protein NBRC110019_04820 [Neptunitalea chrysea]